MTRLSIEQVFEEFDHAVATTAGFKGCYRLLSMTDAQKTDWVEKMVSKSGIPWLWLAHTAPGAGLITKDFQATLDFWSSQVPLQEMENVIGFGAH